MSRNWDTKGMGDARRALYFIRTQCVSVPDGCIEYTGRSIKEWGHVQVTFANRRWYAHRFVYHALVAPVPKDMVVCHTCDNPKCMNVEHMWLGTTQENTRDMVAKRRHRLKAANEQTHCLRGHPLSGDNLGFKMKRKVKCRACKACQRGRQRVLAGWPEGLAYSMPASEPGQRPMNKRWERPVPQE